MKGFLSKCKHSFRWFCTWRKLSETGTFCYLCISGRQLLYTSKLFPHFAAPDCSPISQASDPHDTKIPSETPRSQVQFWLDDWKYRIPEVIFHIPMGQKQSCHIFVTSVTASNRNHRNLNKWAFVKFVRVRGKVVTVLN